VKPIYRPPKEFAREKMLYMVDAIYFTPHLSFSHVVFTHAYVHNDYMHTFFYLNYDHDNDYSDDYAVCGQQNI
jgi:hypothetical protein